MKTATHPVFSPKILQALEFAALAHKSQARKFPAASPYISHPAAVGMILLQHGYGPDTVVAGILHDVIEDTEFTAKDIRRRFGSRVLRLVEAVTEDKGLPWQKRKEAYNRALSRAESQAKAISAADLLANSLSSLEGLRQGQNIWKHFSKDPALYARQILEFYRQRLDIISKDKTIPFVGQLEAAVTETEELTGKNIRN